ncbi:hypothetical protein TRIUR3_07753 [Triticum urartu]|uniref:Uncharacterized protein n=1 Tax=Triticum urartu TaxID=4572 RepID=M7YVR9_TRIUA|nr:hypothetical protein TRIUR3_07753 [Triticum urartu]
MKQRVQREAARSNASVLPYEKGHSWSPDVWCKEGLVLGQGIAGGIDIIVIVSAEAGSLFVCFEKVSPVAVDERSTMFYGTSTSPGAKCLDSVFFLMNPRPEYSVHFLEPVRTDNPRGSIEVANQVQGVLAGALGFTPTALTRKDKYLLLAGNEGVVATKTSKVI